MEIVVKILFGVVLIIFVWWVLQPRRAFVVRVEEGQPKVVHGQVSSAFVQEVGDVCREFGIRSGKVYGNWRGKRIHLAFSLGITPACQQRLRNVWHAGP